MKEELNSIEDYKRHKAEKHKEMVLKQIAPYDAKVKMAMSRIREFIKDSEARGYNNHVSVGGLDSIVLLALIRYMGYSAAYIKAVSASHLEDKSIQQVHKEMGCIVVKPAKSKIRVLQEEGFPLLSKKIANKVNTIANPTPENATVRHAIITGECGEQGHYAKDSKMKLPKYVLEKYGGLDEEGRALGYQIPPKEVLLSSRCCYYLKEKPCDDWAKQHKSFPFLGLMASEGGQREDALEENGCNYFGKTTARSCPFSFFFHDEILHLAVDLNVHVPEIYGTIKKRPGKRHLSYNDYDHLDEKGEPTKVDYDFEIEEYYSDGEQRTGCSMCGFGIQLEKRPHRFDRLYERNPKEWDFWMNHCCRADDGTKYGWGKVLDYVGIPWRDPAHWWMKKGIDGQMSMFDYMYSQGIPEFAEE